MASISARATSTLNERGIAVTDICREYRHNQGALRRVIDQHEVRHANAPAADAPLLKSTDQCLSHAFI